MIEYVIADEFATTAEQFWQTFFDDDYNAKLFTHLDIAREQLEFRREGDGPSAVIHRSQRLTPRRDVPAFMRKVVAGSVTYVEKNVCVLAQDRMEIVTIPNYLAGRFTTEGVYWLEPTADGVKRTWKGRCECRVPVIGARIERQVVDEVESTYRAITAFTRDWIAAAE